MKSDNPGHVRAARFLGDGRSLVVAADTHPVRIFDVKSGEQVAEVAYTQPDPTSAMPPFIATTAKGLVVLGGYGGDLVVYDTKAKAERYRLPAIANNFPMFAVSETGGLLATTPGENRSVFVQLRKLETAEPVWETEAEGDRSAYSMAFSRDGRQLAVAVHGQVYVYATADKKLIKKVAVYRPSAVLKSRLPPTARSCSSGNATPNSGTSRRASACITSGPSAICVTRSTSVRTAGTS